MPDIEDIDIDREIILEDFANEELWTRQTESDLLPPYTLEDLLVAAEVEIEGDESRPADERGLLLAARRILAERERDLALMGEKPLTKGFVADDIWLILRELCRKRVENPGDPLVLWLSGGIQARDLARRRRCRTGKDRDGFCKCFERSGVLDRLRASLA